MNYDMFTPESNVILFRVVVNDAVVGPWQELKNVREHTLDGLKEWLRNDTEEQWDLSQLRPLGDRETRVERVPYWGLVDYGLRLQFWVPKHAKKAVFVKGRAVNMVCVDTFGLDDLTEGKNYEGTVEEDGLVKIKDDKGVDKEFFRDRFKMQQMFVFVK